MENVGEGGEGGRKRAREESDDERVGEHKRVQMERVERLNRSLEGKQQFIDEVQHLIVKAIVEKDETGKRELQQQKTELERDIAKLEWEIALELNQNEGDIQALKVKYEKLEKKVVEAEVAAKQLQVLSLSSPLKDVTVPIFDTLLSPLERVPSRDELQQLMASPVLARIPVLISMASEIQRALYGTASFEAGITIENFLVSSDADYVPCLDTVLSSLHTLNVAEQVKGKTEDQVHVLYNILIQEPMSKLLQKRAPYSFNRNAVETGEHVHTTHSGKRNKSSQKSSNKKTIVREEAASTVVAAVQTDQVVVEEEEEVIVQKKEPCSSTRPDFLLHINNFLLLRGEEKKDGDLIIHAEEDLLKKMVWNPVQMNEIPYLFSYCAAGARFQLVILHPMDYSDRLTRTKIGEELDLCHVKDRLKLLTYIIHMTRVILRIHQDIPADVPRVNEVWHRASGQDCEITLRSDHIEKELTDLEDIQWSGAGGLEELYNDITEGRIKGTVRLKEAIRGIDARGELIRLTLLLEPLGYRTKPKRTELYAFLQDVLSALNSMHENGWVHCDVKMKNIVQTVQGRWILIDLEYAAKLDEKGTAPWPFFDRPDYPMPVKEKEESRWGPRQDIQQVGIMIKSLFEKETLPSILLETLLNPPLGASAADCLRLLQTKDAFLQ